MPPAVAVAACGENDRKDAQRAASAVCPADAGTTVSTQHEGTARWRLLCSGEDVVRLVLPGSRNRSGADAGGPTSARPVAAVRALSVWLTSVTVTVPTAGARPPS